MINFINHFCDIAKNSYHVDPTIFLIFYIISVPIYYLGWGILLKAVYTFRQKHKGKSLKAVSKDRNFKIGFYIILIGGYIPYPYIIFCGRNLPAWFWIFLIIWLLLPTYFFWQNIKKHINHVNHKNHKSKK
jgi:hypothetical protein